MKPGAFCATRLATSTSMISRQAPSWLSNPSEAPASQVRRKTPVWRRHLPAQPCAESHPPPGTFPILHLVVTGTFLLKQAPMTNLVAPTTSCAGRLPRPSKKRTCP